MSLREALAHVAREYPFARGRAFRDDPLAAFVRRDLVRAARGVLGPEHADLRVKASPGRSAWAAVPWLAFFDPLVTDTVRRGYYVVWLFDAEMACGHLVLVHGTQATIAEVGWPAAGAVLRERAALIRARLADRLPGLPEGFSTDPIDLRSDTVLARSYEAGVALGRRYPRDALPVEAALVRDLHALLGLYRVLVRRGGVTPTETLMAETGATSVAGVRAAALARAWERHAGVRRAVLRARGATCAVCRLEPGRHYGLADPAAALDIHCLAVLDGPEEAPPDVRIPEDFAVLCPTCHRLAHLRDDPGDLEGLRARVRFSHLTEILGDPG